MRRAIGLSHGTLCAFVASIVVFAAGMDLLGQDAKKKPAKPRGRLPVYYSRVVTPDQREEIYSIQQKYEPEVAKLEAELEALRGKIQAEVEGVLSKEQLAQVQKLTEEAAARRAASRKSATPAKTGTTTKSPKPTSGATTKGAGAAGAK